ncbi:T9SS C-terminal target domain-containing protein [Bacteroidetes/Chlorobi group bacterium ChocPot_Mid]|nr:MAG: T9SS C-terminal target domain-containing protein [Bacteroidetes/Chlorobi group bacterium ChocPot_Mid]
MKYIVNLIFFLFVITATRANQNNYPDQSNMTDGEGRANYCNDRIYLKINNSAKSIMMSKTKKENTLSKFGIEEIDNILGKYSVRTIENAFKQRISLPDKVKERIQNQEIQLPDLSRIYTVKVAQNQNLVKLIKELKTSSFIEYAELVPLDYPLEVPNDSMYSQCQHLPQIKAEEAWNIIKGETSDSTILVGICDTGTDWNHSDLTNNLWQNLLEDADKDGKVIEWNDSLKKYVLDPGDLNGIDDDNNGFVDDLIGWDFLEDYEKDSQGNNPEDFNNHGTHVAGISAGVTNNANGIASISWNVKFVPTSHSAPGFNYILRGFEGIVYLAELGCDIINCSWGGGGYSRANAEAIEYANALGTLVVVAAGNNNYSEPFYPSSYPYVVSVASVASTDAKASYSNYGNHVDISAPGGQTNIDGGILSCVRNGGYQRFQGTSMASPVAAGSFALVKAKYPNWTNEQLKRQVIGTADNIDSLNTNYKNMLGSGRINVYRALTEKNIQIPKTLKLDLVHVEADDSTGNANQNKALEPGETIRLGFLIRNYSILTGSEKSTLRLSCEDDYIEIISDSCNTKFIPDGYTETPLVFEVKISDKAKSKFVKFTLTPESEDAEIQLGQNMTFYLPINSGGILIWEGQSRAQGYSGDFISTFLTNQGVENIYTNIFPVSLVGYDAVFLSFGSIGSNYDAIPLNDWMASDIVDYLKNGGKLYIEGMDILGFDQMHNKEFLSLLGIDSTADGSDKAYSIDSLYGQSGTICEGLTFWKANVGGFQSIDNIFPNNSGKVALFEKNYGNAAIQNEGEYGQRTFSSVYPIGHLIDRKHPNSRYELIKRIMNFFGLSFDYVVPKFTYYPKTGHAPLKVNFNDESYTSVDVLKRIWDYEGNGNTKIETNPETSNIYLQKGDYNSFLTLETTKGTYTVSNPLYVFDGESSVLFEENKLGQIADTTLNIREDFTVEAWIMPSNISTSTWEVLMDKVQVSLNINNTRSLRLYTYHDNRSITEITTSPESITFTKWQHVAVTFDGDSTFKIYINGNEQELKYLRGPGKGLIKDNKLSPFTIGKSYDWWNAFEGRIDEFRFWSKARTKQEIRSTMFRKLNGNEDSLMIYWKFNEGNGDTAKDFSNHNRTCKLNSDWRQGIHEGHITEQPKSNMICEGKPYVLSVEVVTGGDSLLYQWVKDSKAIPKANERKYYIDEMTKTDVGNYQVMITNNDTWDREFSDIAYVGMGENPKIIEQTKGNLEFKGGDTLLLNVSAKSDTPLEYEWFKDDTSLNYYKPQYRKEKITIDDAGKYYCVVMNDCGFIESERIYVTVISEVENDEDDEINFDIQPNPVNENSMLIINSDNKFFTEIIISDILGKEINKTDIVVNGKVFLNINKLLNPKQSGIYYITIKYGNYRITKPIIYLE